MTNYLIYPVSPNFNARNEITGTIDFTGTDFATVVNQALSALTSGGKVLIAPGTFVVSTSILVPSNCILEGSGKYNTLLQAKNALNNHVIVNQPNASNIEIKNIGVLGNSANQTGNAFGISFANGIGSYGLIENCYISDVLTYSIFIAQYSYVQVRNCVIIQTESMGIAITDSTGELNTHDISITETRIEGNATGGFGIGVWTSNSIIENIWIRGCKFYNTGLEGINFTAKPNYPIRSCILSDNIHDSCKDSGVVIYNGCFDIIVSNCISKNNNLAGMGATTNCQHVIFLGNINKDNCQFDNAHAGIEVDVNSSECLVVANLNYDDQETPTQGSGIAEYEGSGNNTIELNRNRFNKNSEIGQTV